MQWNRTYNGLLAYGDTALVETSEGGFAFSDSLEDTKENLLG